MKKTPIIFALTLFLGCSSLGYAFLHDSDECRGKCTGSRNCTACKNCSGCAHCSKNGGTCGVCR